MKKILLSLCCLLMGSTSVSISANTTSSLSINKSQFKQWQLTNFKSANTDFDSRVKKAKVLTADIAQLKLILMANKSSVVVSLPLPSGELVDFRLTPSSVMALALTEKYPQIKTFSGYQVNHPENNGRFDITEHGFHGMFHFNNNVVFIEPKNKQSQSKYLSYYRSDAELKSFDDKFLLKTPRTLNNNDKFKEPIAKKASKIAMVSESRMRTYRLAISATGEYSEFHGGTKSLVLSELVTLTNRLNDVYQRDLSVKLELVANNDELIFLDAQTDSFNNNDEDGELNTNIIDGLIGSANYDIGHVVNTEGGGLAALGVVCYTAAKGDGVTGASNPTNDAFYIDYVAHEIGHQFGGDHTFNGSEEACEGNRETALAFEPGSASTIMGYAGICGSQSLQNNSDPYFHAKSIEQINTYLTQSTGNTCGNDAAEVNNVPAVDAGSDYVIPANTPFTLTGSATDSDSTDSLTYSWQQIDLGTISNSAAEQIDDGSRPLFRVWNPIPIAQRTLPQLSDVLAASSTIGETYATTDRALNFRLLVRDARGGVGFDDNQITVKNTSEAFAVTAPSSGIAWSSEQQVVSWNTANSQNSPISCAKVDILLSIDSGNSFDIRLGSQVDNNGSFEVTIPNITSSASRIKVACSDNIFFAINGGDFTVDFQSVPVVPVVITGQNSISFVEGEGITLTTSHFTFTGPTVDSISVSSGENHTVSGTTVTANSGFTGNLTVGITAQSGSLMSESFAATIAVTAKPVVVPPTKKSSSGSFYWLLSLLVLLTVNRKSSRSERL